MDIAIVTGAASGIGLAISRRLVDLGLRVYGLGGNYGQTPYSHEYFVPTPCDLSNPLDITEKVEAILEKEGNIFVLVNNAKVYPSTAFLDKISLAELETVLRVNLLCPLILARLALPSLTRLQGFIVNIAPSTADLAKGGPAGAASAGGLRWMGQSLFEECREYGVKVTSIFPQTNLAEKDKKGSVPVPEKSPQSAIDIEAVADAVESVVKNPHGNIITEMVIRPQRLSEKPVPPPLIIPIPQGEQVHQPVRRATTSDMVKTRAAIRKAVKKKAAKPRPRKITPLIKKPVEEASPQAESEKRGTKRYSRKPRQKPVSYTKKAINKPKPKSKISEEKKKPEAPAKKSMRNRSRKPKRDSFQIRQRTE